jgi:hypothetical protein
MDDIMIHLDMMVLLLLCVEAAAVIQTAIGGVDAVRMVASVDMDGTVAGPSMMTEQLE